MNPMPPLSLVRDLNALDSSLRIRWGVHQHLWIIETKMQARQPGYLAEKPNPLGNTPRARDWWDGWSSGYLFVTQLPHPIPYPAEFVIAHLKHLSLEAHRAKEAIISRLDAAEAEDEERRLREWARVNEIGSKEIWDRLQWDNKRAISTHVAGPNPDRVEHDGFTTYDRRKVTA